MAIAYDAKSTKAGSSNLTWTHTPVGTPKAIIVCVGTAQASDVVTSVTYGGEAMTEITGSPRIRTGEASSCYAYFLGANIPTGAQTVVVTKGSTLAGAICISLTATVDTTEIVATDDSIDSASLENPSSEMSLAGATCWAAECFMPGQDAVASITPTAGWTSGLEYDLGTVVFGMYYYDTVGSADVTIGWTQAAEDAIALGFGIAEVTSSSYTLTIEVATFDMGDFGVGLRVNSRVISAAVGPFTLTGIAALLIKHSILNVSLGTIIVIGNDVSLVKTEADTINLDVTTATFIITNKKAQLIKYTPSGATPMHTKTTILDALITQLVALPEVATATRVLLTPNNARKSSPYVGLIAGPEEIVVEDTTNIRYELDVDIILLKKGIDIESMLDAVKIKLFSAPLATAIGALQVRIVGQEPVALIDEDNYSSTRIVTVITYVVAKDAF